MPTLLNIVVLDDTGAISFASEPARTSGLADAIVDHMKGTGAGKRISATTYKDEPHVVLAMPTADDMTAVVVHREDKSSTLVDFILSVDIAFDILNHFLTNPFEGITVVDQDSVLRYLSPVHERFFGHARGDAVGRPVQDVIENTRLHIVAKTGTPEIGQVQEMRNVARVVNRVPILRDGQLVGAIGRVMFKAPEEVHELSRQISSLRAEVDYYKKELAGLRHRAFGLEEIVGESDAIRQLKEEIRKVAPLDVPVFISGESGSGKELVAHAIHNLSRRVERPMVVLNCGALPSTLVESELFGYEAGAFTGARREGRSGKFEMADRSSLFLDEIGDMPMETQIKLLRVVENGVFERVGSNRARTTNFRLISATNRDLRRMISEEAFRADLYFRINGVTLYVPPLRERSGDIPLLVRHFVQRVSQRIGSPVRRIHPLALQMLQGLSWPGNVRQLHHEVQRAMIFADGSELTLANFRSLEDEAEHHQAPPPVNSSATIRETVGNVEHALIREALERHSGNKKRAAEELGISRSYLYKKLAEISQRP
ncbi:sigma-54 interaction domain-containing protein [Pseudochelatococcus lubricantis]|uniref:sigma-54 interaction domain-containing protein n=1 Tax=Pseudochelatococcus lubricantis TaxID=1538102 RepID=UPI0035ED8AAE